MKIVILSKPLMFKYEKFYTAILDGENVEFENYVSLILRKFQVRPLDELRHTTCKTIADDYTNPVLEFALNVISSPRYTDQ